jgi:hypothetical protein
MKHLLMPQRAKAARWAVEEFNFPVATIHARCWQPVAYDASSG